MVECILPEELPAEFVLLIPKQREAVKKMMVKGTISSYTLAEDRSKLWIVFKSDTKEKAADSFESLPLAKFMTYHLAETAVHRIVSHVQVHYLCMN